VRRTTLGNDSRALTFNMMGHVWKIFEISFHRLSYSMVLTSKAGRIRRTNPQAQEWNMKEISKFLRHSSQRKFFVLETRRDFWHQIAQRKLERTHLRMKALVKSLSLWVDFGCYKEYLIALPRITLPKLYVYIINDRHKYCRGIYFF
jgi:hypothetical protein